MGKRIPLSRGKFAVVDDDDFEWLSRFNWCATQPNHAQWYAIRREGSGKRQSIYMHRVILGAPSTHTVDHRNGDGLDNQRHNLRLATHAENIRNGRPRINNTSGYRGVSVQPGTGRWKACISFNSKSIHIGGRFETPQEAAIAYDQKARELHGRFARLNFPDTQAEAHA